jgi:hypothetical protein
METDQMFDSITVLDNLELDCILFKLCHKERGLGWQLQRAESAITEYKRWLWLHIQYPNENFSPSGDIDNVWHMHILDTRKYAADCQMLFGKILHHNPYAGMENDISKAQHNQLFEQTKSLYLRHFGEKLDGSALCDSGYCDDITEEKMWRPKRLDLLAA